MTDRHREDSPRKWRKNDTAVLAIEDIGRNGEGIGHAEGYTVFVKDTVPGDTVKVRIVKAGKQFGFGRLEEVMHPSPGRVQPACPIARQCGGCQLQMMQYGEQLRWKEKKVQDDLERIGGFRVRREGSPAENGGILCEPIAGMEEPFRYRNKALFPVAPGKDGRPKAGFYAGRTHVIIPCRDCLLGAEENGLFLQTVLEWMEREKVPAYDEETGRGLVRHVLIRKSFRTGDYHICLIINGTALPGQERLTDMLRQAADGHLAGISFSSNRTSGNTVMGERAVCIWGEPVLTDTLCSKGRDISATFRISPNSFYQVNPRQTQRLYEKVLEYAALDGTETVADLYCGIGTISLFLAARAGRVFGVEAVPEAVEDARENARLNGIRNAEFFTGKAEEMVPLLREKGYKADVVVVDPPRKGCDERLLETITDMAPKRLVYVSCDPATLARDLHYLAEHGFRVEKYQPFDQFPMTVHIETIVLLQKLNS